MDKATFTDRLSTALKAEVPSDVLRKTWIGRRADELNPPIDERRLATYLHGENECPGSILLSLFEKFGPVFEAKVRGTTATQPGASMQVAAEIAESLRAYADKIERWPPGRDPNVVPIAGKGS